MLWFAILALQVTAPVAKVVPIIRSKECAGCSVLRERGLLTFRPSQIYTDERGRMLRIVQTDIATRKVLVAEVGKPNTRLEWIDMGRLFTAQRLAERIAGKRTPIGVDLNKPVSLAQPNH